MWKGGGRERERGNEIISSPEEFSLFQPSRQRPSTWLVSLLTFLFQFSSSFGAAPFGFCLSGSRRKTGERERERERRGKKLIKLTN